MSSQQSRTAIHAALIAFHAKVGSGAKITTEDFRKLLEARGDLTPAQVARELVNVNKMIQAFGLPPLVLE